jgi:hypothetical protein
VLLGVGAVDVARRVDGDAAECDASANEVALTVEKVVDAEDYAPDVARQR